MLAAGIIRIIDYILLEYCASHAKFHICEVPHHEVKHILYFYVMLQICSQSNGIKSGMHGSACMQPGAKHPIVFFFIAQVACRI